MKDLSWFFFLMAIAIACISMSVAYVSKYDEMVDAEAAKAGLQQCVVERRVIWQRECSK